MMTQSNQREDRYDATKKATDRDHFQYLRLLDTMGSDIPNRRKTTEKEDVLWFLRQGAVLVCHSYNCDEAVTLAQRILNQYG
mgnify:CR=1 FL=1